MRALDVDTLYALRVRVCAAHVPCTSNAFFCARSRYTHADSMRVLSLSLSLSHTHTHTHTQRHYINRHNLIGKDLSCLRCPPCKCPAAQSIHTEVLPHTKRFFFFEGEGRFGDTYRQKTESMERPGAGFGV